MYNDLRQPDFRTLIITLWIGFFQSAKGRNMVKDYEPKPFVVNIHQATKQNNTFRTALWTGNHLQVTL